MGLPDLFFHLLNFVAPAAALACVLVLAGHGLRPSAPPLLAWWLQWCVVCAVGAAVLLGGLWWWGRDGKMATYAALVVAAATAQWLLVRGWKR